MNAKDSIDLLGKMLAGIPLNGNYVHITIQKDLLKRLHKVNQMFGQEYDKQKGIQ